MSLLLITMLVRIQTSMCTVSINIHIPSRKAIRGARASAIFLHDETGFAVIAALNDVVGQTREVHPCATWQDKLYCLVEGEMTYQDFGIA